jgi:acetyltransferase-like isoleucine patch superfamily enzyme
MKGKGLHPLHALMDMAGRACSRGYTMVVRGSFASWGKGSRIGRGANLVSPHLIDVGSAVTVGESAWLNAKDDRGDGAATLRIGDGTYIGRMVQINAWRNVTIGRHVMISDRVFISDADHSRDDSERPIGLQGDDFIGPVVIEEGSWIGIGAVILPGVTIGRNAIVAANAVVTRSVPDRTVAGGVPAQVVARR